MAPMSVHERFRDWIAWTGLSEAEIARRLKCDPSYPRKIRLGERRVIGVDLACAIEEQSALPREDGEVWGDGPIRVEEWRTPSTVETPADLPECA